MSEVEPGDDLAGILAAASRTAGIVPARADILVVTQKIVSKAEGRFVELTRVTPGTQALELAAITRKDARLVELAGGKRGGAN
ncbi:coenzyme F420-0:L-glutamate ligase [Sphingomonadaceae bacterium G21617-S1]|jgi:coenzyme F420-0:L-glutamate ligase/coenzyme F420-1:gamma-L-glutamate ligase|nr:coenzyme F420-0:L-glutamate ligase [Sphingomonadaceae bacterium G21617-S1]